MGFPTGERFTGTSEQTSRLERQFLRKAEFMKEHKCPIWNGEFGPVYQDAKDTDAANINQARYDLLGAQLAIYEKHHISWSIWLYKDIGVQGMLHTSSDSPWNRTIQHFLDKKKKYRLDAWGHHPALEAEAAMNPLIKWIDEICPQAKETYPTPWATERHVLRNVVQTFVSAAFSDEFAELFRGMTEEQLDELAKSFSFEQCVQREGLNMILQGYAPK